MPIQAVKKSAEEVAYDAVPYESFSHPLSQPATISVVAKLFGMASPDLKTARVLEIGCAAGGNLLPQALAWPKAKFLGLDISQQQIDHANKQKAALKLDNVEFRQQDILKFDTKGQTFDYIVCHGVFSWVPEAVRQKILEICGKCLSPEGLAFVSYNTLPGWNAVRSLRDMMLYHTSRFTSPADKVRQARFLLDFLAESVPAANAGYLTLIEDERKMLGTLNDSYLYHDHLEETNAQFYFHEFMKQARASKLGYVGDSDVAMMFLGNLPPKAIEKLNEIKDVVMQEQYMDFVTNRRFRHSILSREGRQINLQIQPERIMDFHLTLRRDVEVSGSDPSREIVFKFSNGAMLTTSDLTAGTLFLELLACGLKPVSAQELVERVCKKMGLKDSKSVRDALVAQGVNMVLRGFLQIHDGCPSFVTEVTAKPVAYPLARLQAGADLCSNLTNVMGSSVPANIVSNVVLKRLDGTKTVDDLMEIIIDNIRTGVLKIDLNGVPANDVNAVRPQIRQLAENMLKQFAKEGLLIG